MNYNPLLLLDFYKTTHNEQYPKGITKIVSYYTPRMSRITDDNSLIMFGLQGFIKEYLIKSFNNNFFNRPKDEVLSQYKRIIDHTLGKNIVDYEKSQNCTICSICLLKLRRLTRVHESLLEFRCLRFLTLTLILHGL